MEFLIVKCSLQDKISTAIPVSISHVSANPRLDNVYTIMTDVLVEQALQEKDASRNSRCTTSEKWLAFIGAVSPLRLFQKLETRTIEAVQNWLYHQVTPSLAALELYFGKGAKERIVHCSPR